MNPEEEVKKLDVHDPRYAQKKRAIYDTYYKNAIATAATPELKASLEKQQARMNSSNSSNSSDATSAFNKFTAIPTSSARKDFNIEQPTPQPTEEIYKGAKYSPAFGKGAKYSNMDGSAPVNGIGREMVGNTMMANGSGTGGGIEPVAAQTKDLSNTVKNITKGGSGASGTKIKVKPKSKEELAIAKRNGTTDVQYMAPKTDVTVGIQPQSADVVKDLDLNTGLVKSTDNGIKGKQSDGITNNLNLGIAGAQVLGGLYGTHKQSQRNAEFAAIDGPELKFLDPTRFKKKNNANAAANAKDVAAEATKRVNKNSTSSATAVANTIAIEDKAAKQQGVLAENQSNANTDISNEETMQNVGISKDNLASFDTDQLNKYDKKVAVLNNQSAIDAEQARIIDSGMTVAAQANSEQMWLKSDALGYRGGSDVAVNTIGGDTRTFASKASWNEALNNATGKDKRRLRTRGKELGYV